MALHDHVSPEGWTTGPLVDAVLKRKSHPIDIINQSTDIALLAVELIHVYCERWLHSTSHQLCMNTPYYHHLWDWMVTTPASYSESPKFNSRARDIYIYIYIILTASWFSSVPRAQGLKTEAIWFSEMLVRCLPASPHGFTAIQCAKMKLFEWAHCSLLLVLALFNAILSEGWYSAEILLRQERERRTLQFHARVLDSWLLSYRAVIFNFLKT
jgi:hypothetical protein